MLRGILTDFSGDQDEYQKLEQLTFIRFLDLKFSDKIPDSKTIA